MRGGAVSVTELHGCIIRSCTVVKGNKWVANG